MMDSILLKLVERHTDSKILDAMQADDFEQPNFYSSWIAPLRSLLAMRYLKHKTAVLKAFTEQGVYPVHKADYVQALTERLKQKAWFGWLKNPEYCFAPFTSILFYPAVVAALLFGSWQLQQWYIAKNMEQALADRMPFYSELLHRAQVSQQNQRADLMEKFLAQAEQERDTIIRLVPDKGEVHEKLRLAMDSMGNEALSNAEIMIFFKKLNAEMDEQRLPYYMSPKLFNVLCNNFAPSQDAQKVDMITTLQRLFEGQQPNSNKPMCRTGIITVYKVTDRRALDFQLTTNLDVQNPDSPTSKITSNATAEELPLFHVTRADRVPAADGALGLTFKNQGIGSIILLDQIKRFAEQSVLPALTFQGRSFIIPYWLQGYYDIEESITKNYKSDLAELFSSPDSLQLLRAAAKEMLLDQKHLSASRMQQTLQRSMPAEQATGVLGGSLDALSTMMATKDKATKPAQAAAQAEIDALMQSLLPSIEYHEAYHQIIKDKWPVPKWVPSQFEHLSEKGIEASLEELGAYLTQLVYTDTGHKIWLTKLLLFSINSMTQDQPEYYASSLIFSAMRDLYLKRDVEANHELTVDEKVEIYKALSTYSPLDLNQLAQKAFEELFERPVVRLQ
ncbi:MAG: hypothetical protein ACPG47_05955 [Leucothrix sp.]